MENLITKKMLENITTKIFIINMKKIRELGTKAAKEMVDVYNEVKKMFIKSSIPANDETSESETEEQEGQGLKILTPKQMIIRLPILLAQLRARNNSQKLKNEIRQIVYSLYRSKNLSKTIYNNLINAI